jgi:hypothetical protein
MNLAMELHRTVVLAIGNTISSGVRYVVEEGVQDEAAWAVNIEMDDAVLFTLRNEVTA